MSKPPRPPEEAGGYLRGLAAALRGSRPAVRALGEARPLAFTSEVAVAGQRLFPRPLYLGLWGLSIAAVGADVTTKVWDARPETRARVAAYQLAFHIPASLVVPAIIIHQVVHRTAAAMSACSPRARALVPVAAAVAAIVPVVPLCDHAFEALLRPTLGRYLELEWPERPAEPPLPAERPAERPADPSAPANPPRPSEPPQPPDPPRPAERPEPPPAEPTAR